MKCKVNKYHAVVTERRGIKFASKAEAKRYDQLNLLQQAGDVIFFLRQPLFDLTGGVTYRADFLVFWKDGRVSVEDVKGFLTAATKMKIKLVEAKYPIKIELIKIGKTSIRGFKND